MKRILILFLLTGGIFSAAGQIYVPGEELFYRVSYRAKLVPNTEVATVVVRTSEVELDGQTVYNVFGQGKTLASFRWFFSLDDRYNIWVDTATLRMLKKSDTASMLTSVSAISFRFSGSVRRCQRVATRRAGQS